MCPIAEASESQIVPISHFSGFRHISLYMHNALDCLKIPRSTLPTLAAKLVACPTGFFLNGLVLIEFFDNSDLSSLELHLTDSSPKAPGHPDFARLRCPFCQAYCRLRRQYNLTEVVETVRDSLDLYFAKGGKGDAAGNGTLVATRPASELAERVQVSGTSSPCGKRLAD